MYSSGEILIARFLLNSSSSCEVYIRQIFPIYFPDRSSFRMAFEQYNSKLKSFFSHRHICITSYGICTLKWRFSVHGNTVVRNKHYCTTPVRNILPGFHIKIRIRIKILSESESIIIAWFATENLFLGNPHWFVSATAKNLYY